MAVKTNYAKGKSKYFRVSAVLGKDCNGKKIIKEFYGKSKSEAEEKKNKYLNGVADGLSIDVDNISIGELMRMWLFEIRRVSDKLKPSSFEKYEGVYRNYIEKSPLYSINLKDVKTIQIQRYYNDLHSKGKSKSIIHNVNKLLKQFFFYAVDEGYIIKNPCSGKRIVIPGEKKIQKEVEHFTDYELSILLDTIRDSSYKELIIICIGTGMRRGEALALTWEDIDLSNNTININKSLGKVYFFEADGSKTRKQIIQPPKTLSSNREIPFPRSLNTVFKDIKIKQKRNKLRCGEYYEDSNFVFTTQTGTNIDVTNLSHAWEKILKKAELPHKKFHALRHTYATKLFENKVELKTASKLLGHSSIEMTADIYTHVIPKQKIDAVEKLNYIFENTI
ncbi:tyrosine-type recombinase/integrase [Clostridium butyricum]|jgi:integrase|uniref:tyrosine-type recombinase/integrase n=1 Tax=Clostridium butyricum TaxID=1492 RepID=UPI00290D4C3B|nr:site-specific integrase [Clostridium butyricum]MDU5821914.1 site-specific integrase [Clostridium butyricum]